MMANRRSILALVASVFLTPAQAQVVVGHVVPLTGLQAPTGSQLSIGAKACIEHVNKRRSGKPPG